MKGPFTQGAPRHLGRCQVFDSLTSEQAARLDRTSRRVSFKRRSIVYAPSDLGRAVFVIASGRVKIKNVEENGKEAILAFVEEREIFGELALVDCQLRGEFAEAIKDSRLLEIPREEMLWLMDSVPTSRSP